MRCVQPTWAVQNANDKDARTLSNTFSLSRNLLCKYILQEKNAFKQYQSEKSCQVVKLFDKGENETLPT